MPMSLGESRRRWLRRLALLAVAVVVAVLIFKHAGRIDWAAVGEALGRLSWWQPVVLLLVVAVRQVLNASPLHFFVEGITLARATQNDLGATLMSTVAPGPANYALRVAMFSSWGVPAARGAAGALMNSLTLGVVRFSAPLAGFVFLAAVGGDATYRWSDLASLALAIGIVVGVMLVLRSDRLAQEVGLRSGRLVQPFRRGVDPQRWAQGCVDFRGHVSDRFRYGFPRSLAGASGMLADDLVLLVLSLRFVDVSAGEAGIGVIAIAYLFAFPLTFLPFSGIGVVDSVIVAALVQASGPALEGPAVAGLVVWRIFTIGVPALAGLAAIALWRRTAGTRAAAAPETQP